MSLYSESTKNFKTIVDFLRFGVSMAKRENLYYGHGTDNAFDDIWMLILGSLSLPRDIDTIFLQSNLTEDEKNYLREKLESRIKKQIPVPYLTNESYFCDLDFYVDERVLIPRSPIAELIKQQFVPWIDPFDVHRVLDLCTGSGCIAIACSYAFPDALVDAADISKDALDVALINKKRHHLKDSLNLIQSDVFKKIADVQYDIIISNPPYVSSDEMQILPKEYTYEPSLALEAQNHGLAIVEDILNHAGKYLSRQGILVVEVGNSQQALIDAYPHIPFTWLEFAHGGDGVFILTAEQLQSL